jgi:hypothetical protein
VLGFVTNGIRGCGINPLDGAPIAEDCLRNTTVASGRFTVTATQTITGARGEVCNGPCVQIAVPVTRDGVGLTASALVPVDFAIGVVPPGEPGAARTVALSGGTVSFELVPILGENAQMLGVFDIATPVARFSRVRLQGVAASLDLDGLRFDVTIDASDYAADVGFYEGRGNRLAGTMTLDGQRVPLGGPLDPGYQQARFDLGYDCTPNLRETVPPTP